MDSNHQAIAGGEALCSPDCIWHQLLLHQQAIQQNNVETETFKRCSSYGICTATIHHNQNTGNIS